MLFYQPTNSTGNYSYNAFIYDDVDYRSHFHKNFELIYVMDGQVMCTANEKSAILSSGEWALCLSHEVHSLQSLGSSRCWVGVFSGDFVHAFEKQTKGKIGHDFVFRCEPDVEDFLKRYLIREETPPIYLLKSCLYAACHEYRRQITLTERTGTSDLLMQAIVDYIMDNYQHKISLVQMAKALGYNYHYLSKCFRKFFSVSFTDFLNLYRLDMALSLLVETDKNIADIALESGFQSIRNFNDFFKAHTGTTPAKYRTEIQ